LVEYRFILAIQEVIIQKTGEDYQPFLVMLPLTLYYEGNMRKRPHAQYAAILLAVLSFVANVTAIAGLIMSNGSIIVVTAAVLATLYGLYLFLRRWGKPVDWLALLSVMVIVAGSVMLSLALKTYQTADATGSETADSGATTDKSQPSGRGGEPVKPDSKHDVVLEKQFT
jgi:hypothetical protein